jgi:hypothetical protein
MQYGMSLASLTSVASLLKNYLKVSDGEALY